MKYDFKNTYILGLISDKIGVGQEYLNSAGVLKYITNHNNHVNVSFAILKVTDSDSSLENKKTHFINYIKVCMRSKG